MFQVTFRVYHNGTMIAESYRLWNALDHADAVRAKGGFARIVRYDGNTETEVTG
jgi:hypothetical protein